MEPFDPKKHKPIELPNGGMATEYTATERSPDGKWWNIPQIWFNPAGNPTYPARYQNIAEAYEKKKGEQVFQRFDSQEEAVSAAQGRSDSGGGTSKNSRKSLLTDG